MFSGTRNRTLSKLIAVVADIAAELRDELFGILGRLGDENLFIIVRRIVSVQKRNRTRFVRFILGMEDDHEAEERAGRNPSWSAARYIAAGPVYIDAMWEGLEEYRKTGVMPN